MTAMDLSLIHISQGQEIGNSLCEADKLDYALEMIKKAEEKGVKLLLPVDHVEGKEFSNDTEHKDVYKRQPVITSIPSRLRNFSAILWDVSYSSIESSGWRWSSRRNWIISSLHCSAFSLICSVSISFLPELE